MKKRNFALLCGFLAICIYGINHSIAKEVTPLYIKPIGFILIRVVGAASLFWIAGIWATKERIARSDWGRLLACVLLGMCINMIFFLKALTLTTPVNLSLIGTTSPVIVFILCILFIGEKLTFSRALGIVIGMAGVLTLIFFGVNNDATDYAPNIPLGNLLNLGNALSYGLFFIVSKPLLKKYHFVTVLKWAFLLAIFINLPISYSEFSEIQWAKLPTIAIWGILYVVVCTTFLTYFLNMIALNSLKASTVSSFIYLEPFVAMLVSVAAGKDILTTQKICSATLIFLGVYLVQKKPQKH